MPGMQDMYAKLDNMIEQAEDLWYWYDGAVACCEMRMERLEDMYELYEVRTIRDEARAKLAKASQCLDQLKRARDYIKDADKLLTLETNRN